MKLFNHLVSCDACSGGGFTGDSENIEDDVCPYCVGLGMVAPDQAPKKCSYCDEIVNSLTGTPYFADGGAGMCENCWEVTREDNKGTYGEDIGKFKPKEESE